MRLSLRTWLVPQLKILQPPTLEGIAHQGDRVQQAIHAHSPILAHVEPMNVRSILKGPVRLKIGWPVVEQIRVTDTRDGVCCVGRKLEARVPERIVLRVSANPDYWSGT